MHILVRASQQCVANPIVPTPRSKNRHLVAGLALPIALLMLMTACAPAPVGAVPTPPSQSNTPPPASSEASESPTATQSSEPAPEVITNTLTDKDGYRSRVDVTSMSISADSDVSSQKPGQAMIYVTLGADATITNLTTGHNLTSTGAIDLAPAWKNNSIVCSKPVQELARGAFEALTIGGDYYGAPKFCALSALMGTGQGVKSLAPQQTTSLIFAQNPAAPGGGNPAEKVLVPEKNFEQVETALKHPDFWILMRYIGDYDVTNVDGVCRDSSGISAVVATTRGGAGLCTKVRTDKG